MGDFFAVFRCAATGAPADDGDDADDVAADEGVAVAAESAGDCDGAVGDDECGAIAAALCCGLADAPPFVAEHPQMTTAAPLIKTGSEWTRKAHLAYSSDVLPRM